MDTIKNQVKVADEEADKLSAARMNELKLEKERVEAEREAARIEVQRL